MTFEFYSLSNTLFRHSVTPLSGMVRGLSLPPVSDDETAEATEISLLLMSYFTFMRGMPEERKHLQIHAHPADVCLAVLQRILISLPTPDWFRQALKFDGVRPVEYEDTYAEV